MVYNMHMIYIELQNMIWHNMSAVSFNFKLKYEICIFTLCSSRCINHYDVDNPAKKHVFCFFPRKQMWYKDSPKACACSLRGFQLSSFPTFWVWERCSWTRPAHVTWMFTIPYFHQSESSFEHVLRYLGVLNANDKTLELLDMDNSLLAEAELGGLAEQLSWGEAISAELPLKTEMQGTYGELKGLAAPCTWQICHCVAMFAS